MPSFSAAANPGTASAARGFAPAASTAAGLPRLAPALLRQRPQPGLLLPPPPGYGGQTQDLSHSEVFKSIAGHGLMPAGLLGDPKRIGELPDPSGPQTGGDNPPPSYGQPPVVDTTPVFPELPATPLLPDDRRAPGSAVNYARDIPGPTVPGMPPASTSFSPTARGLPGPSVPGIPPASSLPPQTPGRTPTPTTPAYQTPIAQQPQPIARNSQGWQQRPWYANQTPPSQQAPGIPPTPPQQPAPPRQPAPPAASQYRPQFQEPSYTPWNANNPPYNPTPGNQRFPGTPGIRRQPTPPPTQTPQSPPVTPPYQNPDFQAPGGQGGTNGPPQGGGPGRGNQGGGNGGNGGSPPPPTYPGAPNMQPSWSQFDLDSRRRQRETPQNLRSFTDPNNMAGRQPSRQGVSMQRIGGPLPGFTNTPRPLGSGYRDPMQLPNYSGAALNDTPPAPTLPPPPKIPQPGIGNWKNPVMKPRTIFKPREGAYGVNRM